MDVRDALGRAVGGIFAPLAAEISLIRGAPVFHADGVLVRAEVEPFSAPAPLGELARALAGEALVRFSGALQRYRRGHDPRDVFGAAVRFGAGTEHPQDLLFATFRTVWELPLAPLRTDPRDFLANDYHTVLPSHVPGTAGRFTFRLVPEGPAPDGEDHVDRLERAVAGGRARLRLEARRDARGAPSTPIVSVALRETLGMETSGDAVPPFDPFRDGAGLVPAGFFQAVRAAVYPASALGARVARARRSG